MRLFRVSLLVVGIAALLGIFLVISGRSANKLQSSNTAPTPTPSQTLINIIIKDGKLVSGPETTQVKEGDKVSLNIVSDKDLEVHLHGYDKSVELKANAPGSIDFTADQTGRFIYEIEDTSTEIGAVEVLPK